MRFCKKITAAEQSPGFKAGQEIASELAKDLDKKLNDNLNMMLVENLDGEDFDHTKYTADYWDGVKEVFDSLA